MNFWFFIGIALAIWVIYDFLSGKTWTYRPIYRKYEPLQYWFVLTVWLLISISVIFAGLN